MNGFSSDFEEVIQKLESTKHRNLKVFVASTTFSKKRAKNRHGGKEEKKKKRKAFLKNAK